MPFCRANGVSLYYEMSGPIGAPLLVFSNSLGTILALWQAQQRHFEQNFRILLYDSRGHGASEVTPGPYSIEMLAEDVLGLTASLGIKKFSFCGLSMGGMVGQWIGAHRPDVLEKLILANTAARVGTRESWNQRIRTVEAGGMGAITASILERWFTQRFRKGSPAEVRRVEAMLLGCPVEGYVACCAAIREMDQRATAASIKAQTLVIFGEDDPLTTPELAAFLADSIPGAVAIGLPAAHLSNVEVAEEFNRAVDGF